MSRHHEAPQAGLKEKKVAFILQAPDAKTVTAAGTFTKWDAARTPRRRSADGTWRAWLSLPTGQHEYHFVVDDQWVSTLKANGAVANPHGSDNSVLIV